mmetsp:Transcript_5820/g.11511  ORF Transcript_5820/g.11511 Transcript_5820/m.11511 type:complete len:94 (-) Transcript_5820:1486-1767(-)
MLGIQSTFFVRPGRYLDSEPPNGVVLAASRDCRESGGHFDILRKSTPVSGYFPRAGFKTRALQLDPNQALDKLVIENTTGDSSTRRDGELYRH